MGHQLVVLGGGREGTIRAQCSDPEERDPSPVASWGGCCCPSHHKSRPPASSPEMTAREKRHALSSLDHCVLLSAQDHWAPGLVPVATELSRTFHMHP